MSETTSKFYKSLWLLGTTLIVLVYLIFVGWPKWPGREDWLNTVGTILPAGPCQTTTFALGNIDERFKISKDNLVAAVNEAAGLWEESVRKDLFVYSPTGVIKVNLIYDSRQQAIDQLKSIEGGLVANQTLYAKLKARYDQQQSQYLQNKAGLDSLNKTYQSQLTVYEQEVNRWNKRGGAPADKFQELEKERLALQVMADNINAQTASLNSLVEAVNATAAELNRLAKALNLTVDQYNGIAVENGTEFTEGDYQEDGTSRSINIYEFSTHDQLVRVLAHELGHALGLEHTDNKDDIMYRVNQSLNNQPTTNDISQLKLRCVLP